MPTKDHMPVTLTVVIALATMTGCTTAAPAPTSASGPSATDPSATEAAACAPDDAEVTWQPAFEAEDAALGFQVQSIEADGTVTTENRLVPYEPTVSSEKNETVERVWVDALIADFGRTGQSAADPALPPPDFDSVQVAPGATGTFVVGFWTSQLAVPFQVSCDGADDWNGQLLTSGGDERGTVLVQCGYSPPDPSDFSDEALAECPEA